MRAALIAALGLMACQGKPETVTTTGNPEFKVERLFTHEGCTVYRFEDGYSRYFVKCDDGRARAEWTETHPCGKGCTRTEAYGIDTETP